MASESRHNEEPSKKERHLYAGKGSVRRQKGPKCVFCKGEHYSASCETVKDINSRRKFFAANKLCYNCGQPGNRASNCHGEVVSNGKENAIHLTPSDTTLPPIFPVSIKEVTLWAYLDTGSGRNFISQDAIAKLKLFPLYHETRHIVTVTGFKKQSMPIFNVEFASLDGAAKEEIEVTLTKIHCYSDWVQKKIHAYNQCRICLS